MIKKFEELTHEELIMIGFMKADKFDNVRLAIHEGAVTREQLANILYHSEMNREQSAGIIDLLVKNENALDIIRSLDRGEPQVKELEDDE